eukprot:SAG11_NODE_219_length_12168_cov_5.600083_6_plen_84_part_00
MQRDELPMKSIDLFLMNGMNNDDDLMNGMNKSIDFTVGNLVSTQCHDDLVPYTWALVPLWRTTTRLFGMPPGHFGRGAPSMQL